MKQIRVLLVDDSRAFLESAADFLSRDERVLVVGCAANGREGVELAEVMAPDLVLMDLAMPVMDGLAATRAIKAAAPATRVIIVSAFEGASFRLGAERARVDGIIAKEHFTEGVLAVIDSLSDGRASAAVFVADA